MREGPSEAVGRFYEELTARYPEIDAVPEAEVDNCPWSCALDRTAAAIVMPMVWSRSEEVGSFVLGLARKKGLVVFDPQTGSVIYPDDPPEPGATPEGGLKRRIRGLFGSQQ